MGGSRVIIPATIVSANNHMSPSPDGPSEYSSSNQPHISETSRMNGSTSHPQRNYGTASSSTTNSPSSKGKEPETIPYVDEYGYGSESEDGQYEEMMLEPIIPVSWKYLSRLYTLVPIITLFFFSCLVVIVTYAWPPSDKERKAGQKYPHEFLFWPFLTGIFASFTIQSIRIPTFVVTSWLPFNSMFITILSTIIHTVIHELARLSTLPIITPSPTSGFHSSYYLGLGWGLAEVTWGIVQGWEQLSLYQDVMQQDPSQKDEEDSLGLMVDDEISSSPTALINGDIRRDIDVEEAELERKVEILERMRSRRDLEDVIGIPFPNIPFPMHLLWRLDTLLLNLGLTLILSAYFFNSYPIYQHFPYPYTSDLTGNIQVDGPTRAHRPGHEPSPYLWLVWGLVVLLHVGISLVWKVVGRLGLGAVTWGCLIVSLGSVFAGLGGWGGLV